MPTVLITPRSLTQGGHPALERLREAGYELRFTSPGRQPDEAELLARLPGCVGYLAGVEKISRHVLEAAPGLQVLSRNGTGVDNVDLNAAAELGIRVCRAEGANARGVAELTLALMLALVRDLPHSDATMKAGGWERRQGVELEGRTLGVVGCGRVGRLVCRFGLACDMRVLVHEICPDPALAAEDRFSYAPLQEVLASADILSLHCPPPADGKPLLDAAALARMKPGSYLINTARADLWEEAAVLAALESGHLAAVALDVFPEEPPVDRALLRHDRVIATPHLGGFTQESIYRAVSVAVDHLLEVLATC